MPERREAAEWYHQVVGLPVVRKDQHWADDPRGSLLIAGDSGSTKVALFEGAPQGSTATVRFHVVAFRVAAVDFVRFLSRLSRLDLADHRGQLVTVNSVVHHAVAYSIYYCDPFGRQRELTAHDYEEARTKLPQRCTDDPTRPRTTGCNSRR